VLINGGKRSIYNLFSSLKPPVKKMEFDLRPTLMDLDDPFDKQAFQRAKSDLTEAVRRGSIIPALVESFYDDSVPSNSKWNAFRVLRDVESKETTLAIIELLPNMDMRATVMFESFHRFTYIYEATETLMERIARTEDLQAIEEIEHKFNATINSDRYSALVKAFGNAQSLMLPLHAKLQKCIDARKEAILNQMRTDGVGLSLFRCWKSNEIGNPGGRPAAPARTRLYSKAA
jgi:hypothetical protein